MKIVKLETTLKAENNIWLPDFLGSTLRGALISRLSKKYCTSKNLECRQCKNHICINKQLFNNWDETQGNNTSANPIIINAKTLHNPSNQIELEIILLGSAVIYSEIIANTLEEGLIIKNKELFVATDVDTTIIDLDSIENKYSSGKIKVSLQSQTSLPSSMMGLDFKQFIRAILIRYKAVGEILGLDMNYSYKELTESANDKVSLENKSINIKELVRKSSRTDKKNTVPCIVGELVYSGDFSDYYKYLNIIEYLNMGKWCTMGLGKINIEEIK